MFTSNSILKAKLIHSASELVFERSSRASTDRFRYAFATFDANNDGTIDFDEFILAIAATSQGDVDDRLEVAFEMSVTGLCFIVNMSCSSSRYDVSGDGQIDQKELTNMISAMVGETPHS